MVFALLPTWFFLHCSSQTRLIAGTQKVFFYKGADARQMAEILWISTAKHKLWRSNIINEFEICSISSFFISLLRLADKH